jgi:two-component system OmpR family response regulator
MTRAKAVVAIIDDDKRLRMDLARYLERHSYKIEHGESCADAMAFTQADNIDLMILDRILPDGDSLDVAREIRVATDMPIIILSGIGATEERVNGLEAGADDYLPKPVSPTELQARVRSQLRRSERYKNENAPTADPLKLEDGTRLDGVNDKLIGPDNTVINLTQIETILFSQFIEHKSANLSREDLYYTVLGREWDSYDRSIDVHISHLRQKTQGRRFQYCDQVDQGAGLQDDCQHRRLSP